RHILAPLLTCSAEDLKSGRMTYHLRRLRLRGLIERIPKTHRYQVSDNGLRTALFYLCTFTRIIRPSASHLSSPPLPPLAPGNRGHHQALFPCCKARLNLTRLQ